MVVFHLPDARVADVRFAISPLVETVLSLRVLTAPERFPLQVPWERRARQRMGEVDLPVLRALLNRHGHTPDAITPAPRPRSGSGCGPPIRPCWRRTSGR